MIIDPFRAFVPVTDPFFADVLLLAHFDTSAWVDEIGHTVTERSGTSPTLVSTGAGPGAGFGNAMQLTSSNLGVYYTPTGTEFDFADTDDYTIEIRLRATRTNVAEAYLDFSTGGGLGVNALLLYSNGAGLASGFWNGVDRVYGTVVSPSVWNYLAFENYGGVKTLYVEGTIIGQQTVALNQTCGNVYVGAASPGSFIYNGDIDEVRITAAARYLGVNYTVPTAPFPDS